MRAVMKICLWTRLQFLSRLTLLRLVLREVPAVLSFAAPGKSSGRFSFLTPGTLWMTCPTPSAPPSVIH